MARIKKTIPYETVLAKYKAGESITSLAKKYKVYKNLIYRFLKKHIKIRDKSESQKLALKTGRKEHPTEGTHRTEEERLKIATGKHEAWKKYSPEELEDLSKKGKASWDSLTQQEKDERIDKANDGSRVAAKEGSKVEKFIKHVLEDNGFKARWHTMVLSTKLEVDFFIPSINVAIEVNGPSHYLDIWGADKLKKQQDADNQKYAVLVSKQIHIVRIKYLATKLTLLIKEKLKKDIISLINNIKDEKTIYIHDLEVI